MLCESEVNLLISHWICHLKYYCLSCCQCLGLMLPCEHFFCALTPLLHSAHDPLRLSPPSPTPAETESDWKCLGAWESSIQQWEVFLFSVFYFFEVFVEASKEAKPLSFKYQTLLALRVVHHSWAAWGLSVCSQQGVKSNTEQFHSQH